jgi:predicted nicotinamide N-methyase
VPEIRLYRPHAGSGVRRLAGDDVPPYWAYAWAGGTVLARYVLDHPDSVRGRCVLDLGTGSGVVAIAAAMAGAASVLAVDVDAAAVAAAQLNAEANGVRVDVVAGDWLAGDLPEGAACDLILVGDVFYDAALAQRVVAALDRWGVEALVGDMGRAPLPRERLAPLARYDVPDFGHAGVLPAEVFRFVRADG